MKGYPVILAGATTALFACSPASDSRSRGMSDSGRSDAIEQYLDGGDLRTTYIDARPAALVSGRVVEWGEIRPLLNEAAGGIVLQELILDRQIKDRLFDDGVQVTESDVRRERELFYETLDPDPDVAVRLSRKVRARQGLGRHRFDNLMRRNAALRMLVAPQVDVSEESVRRNFEIVYGPRRQARLMMVGSLQDAQQAINRLEAGEFFGDVAVELSTDSSAPRGGLLSPISRADPSYPPALRDELWALQPGETSPPVLLGEQYAILELIGVLPAQEVELSEVHDAMEKRARLAQQRILMDRLARQLMAQATFTIIDETLQEAWDAQFQARKSR
jgi:parvulin-like peptidyl-prolyl isomerase